MRPSLTTTNQRIRPCGPRPARIAIVGEAPGNTEAKMGIPFVGGSGQLLNEKLLDAGINRRECFITNVFLTQPPENKIEAYCGSKTEVGKAYPYPPLSQGKYFLPQYLPELDRLREELLEASPNLVIALGNTATWALLRNSKITKNRGMIAESTLIPGLKVLATFHPAAALRNFKLSYIIAADLMKAAREAEFPEIRRPHREIWIEPTLEDIAEFHARYMLPAFPGPISVDIETMKHSMVTCVGFAPDQTHAICIPFVDRRKPGWSYWPTAREEAQAWHYVRNICADPRIKKRGQNGLYDMQFLWIKAGIPMMGYVSDTMIAFHARYSELPKDLGFLSSIYTNEVSWKDMRKLAGITEEKDE